MQTLETAMAAIRLALRTADLLNAMPNLSRPPESAKDVVVFEMTGGTDDFIRQGPLNLAR